MAREDQRWPESSDSSSPSQNGSGTPRTQPEETLPRTQTATERFEIAARRDETANLRDRAATARDRATAALDRAEQSEPRSLNPWRAARAEGRAAAAARARAARDREQAAQDREHAAQDRDQAARDREQAHRDLQRAHLDDLTGVYGRSFGSVTLRHEIDRAKRTGADLVLAFADVDGLKQVNDRDGHAAGDLLIQRVAAAIRSQLRSYDPIVRFGGDEFVCALSDTDLGEAERRFEEIQRRLDEEGRGDSISFGLAALQPGDTLEDLLTRGDQALYRVKHAG